MRHRRNLLRRARSAHGDALGHIIHLGLRQLLQYLRTDHRRRHRIHANPFRSYLFADRLSKSDHSRLSRRVAAHIGIAFLAGNRGDIDYPSIAARPHVRQHRAAAMKHAAHIHRDNMLPVIVGELPNRSGSPGDPGVVHQYVNAAGAREHLGHGRIHGVRAGNVDGYGERSAADRLRHFRSALEVQIGDRDGRPGARQPAGYGLANAGTGARDDGRLARQVEEHLLFFYHLYGDFGGNVAVQANGNLEFTKLLDRLVELNLAAVNSVILLRQRLGHILRSDRPEKLVVLAGLLGNDHRNSAQQLRKIFRFALLFGFAAQVRLALLLDNFAVGVRGGYGEPLRQQKVAGIAVGHFDYLAAAAQPLDIFPENDFHDSAP